MVKTELGKLADTMPELATAFRQLRGEVMKAGPLGRDTIELIVVAALACTQRYDTLRVHIIRLLDMNVEPEAIAHALAAGLGAATTLSETVDGLAVLAECVQERSA